ncbi:hypothetical protein DFH08DRAFT_965727 [Mycena albidolilacea]|uniref:Uncharacterized protein n=1 Tax=Mycena albidolilacea TaxID=1033008 RepID=A0AAD7EK92_9AGAR|nr:hypothetical protein DFH08DRAFT_965727 [Mycena albidolilacea]
MLNRHDTTGPLLPERMDDLSCCRSQSPFHAGWTLPVPDTDPADEAELIPTLPSSPLHTTHRLAEGDRSSLLHLERSGTFRRDQLAMPEAPNGYSQPSPASYLLCTLPSFGVSPLTPPSAGFLLTEPGVTIPGFLD